MDVGFLRDKKIRLLMAEFGASSVAFVLYVFGKAYEGDGYFLTWDKDERLLAAEAIQKPHTYVSEVLQGCLSRSIFDDRVFQMFGVLTSRGIQRRYLETDLVEVTAHLGARNKDGPNGWENHAAWQGKVYRWSAKPRASRGGYPDFERTCGYGSVTGIGGANCRHSYWPYIEGVSERTYTDAELEAMKPENRPKIKFEGKEYDDYQATQKQRQIERTARKLKRRKTAFEAAGLTEDAQAASIRLRRLNQEYRVFSKAAGLPEQRERMRALYANNSSEAESDIGDAVRRAAKSITQGKKVVGFTGLPIPVIQTSPGGVHRIRLSVLIISADNQHRQGKEPGIALKMFPHTVSTSFHYSVHGIAMTVPAEERCLSSFRRAMWNVLNSPSCSLSKFSRLPFHLIPCNSS